MLFAVYLAVVLLPLVFLLLCGVALFDAAMMVVDAVFA